ncbi:MAG: response regulator [Candidatus Sabulitectum sp.]|nr:response regulator [Candidatus Sabulitectum sp.]
MSGNLPRILIIDDDPAICEVVVETLKNQGYTVDSAQSGSDVSGFLSLKTYPIVLCDVLLPDTNGLELMSEIKEMNPDTFVILFTGHASVDLAKEAIRQGAYDFITKPFTSNEIIEAVQRAENEQRANFSDITYTELRILHELTVSSKMTKSSKKISLEQFGAKTAESFGADSLRIYLKNDKSDTLLEKTVEIGEGSFADEVTWYFLASRTMQSGGEVLLDPSSPENTDMSGTRASFMGTVIPTSEANLGVILAGRNERRDRFKTRDLKLLALYAAQLGNQLQNLKMTDDLLMNNEELEKINMVTSGFSTSLLTSTVVSSVAHGLRDFIPFDVAGFFVSLESGTLYNYILMNEAIPKDKVHSSLKRQMGKNLGKVLASELMTGVRYGTFVGENIRTFENYPEFTFTELDDYGKIHGWIVMGSWSGRSKLLPSSKFIPILLRHATSALCNSLQYRENQSNYLETITAMAQAVDAKDKYTSDHSRNVTAYALALADKLGISRQERNDLWNAALLHDIGKIGIPETILNKPGKLSKKEYEVIKTHPVKGCSILEPIKAFRNLLPAIRYHHERLDGRGYPDGLDGTHIPFSARILTVADSFDAMTSSRVYRKSLGVEYALEQLEKHSGTQFDRELARAFIELIKARPYKDILLTYGSVLLERQPVLHH